MNKIDKSNVIKAIIKEIAKQYKLSYQPTDCTCDDNCSEVTVKADNDWNTLQEQLKRKGIDHIDWYENIWKQLENPGKTVLKDTPFKRRKRFFFKECAISRWNRYNPEEWWEDVDEGEQLVLIRDYNNKHDFNAVAIAFAGDYEGDPEYFDFEYIIGYVPQSPAFDPSDPVSVSDLFACCMSRRPAFLGLGKAMKDTVAECLSRVHGEELVNKRVGTLSGGELQRVLLALALEPIPNILILDEPLSGVDVEGMETLMDMLDEIRKNYDLSILMTTHDFSLLPRYADQVVLIDHGVLIQGDPQTVLDSEEFHRTFHMRGGRA